MRSTSLYVFIALGALLISCTSAAPIPGLAKSDKPTQGLIAKSGMPIQDLTEWGKQLVKSFLKKFENMTMAEAEVKTSTDSVGNEVDALIQVTFDVIQSFFNGMNEALVEEQRNMDGGRGDRHRGYSESYDASEVLASITAFTWNMFKLLPQIGSKYFG